MRKCYCPRDIKGETRVYWEEFLGKADRKDVFEYKYNKYLPKFDRFIPKGSSILEGGCGLGQYVKYYSDMGFSITGIDFSEKLIKKAREINKKSVFKVADVKKLPFEDSSFDVYILNGVLEHLENGPAEPLKEACRVLKKGGILLITLQYINILRAIADFATRFTKTRRFKGANIEGEYKLVNRFEAEREPCFHSYFFNKSEALGIFADSGFEVVAVSPLSVENGLGDYRLFRKKSAEKKNTVSTVRRMSGENKFFKEWIKMTFIREEPRDLLGLFSLRILQAFFGSMILVAARKV